MKIFKNIFSQFLLSKSTDNMYFIWLYICFLLFIVLLFTLMYFYIHIMWNSINGATTHTKPGGGKQTYKLTLMI